MVDGEAPAPYFERMSIIREKLAEAGITQSDQEANLDVWQCLSSDHALDNILLLYTSNLALTYVEDRLHKTQRKMDESRKAIDGSAHVLIESGGPDNFPAPGTHQSNWNGTGKDGIGQQQQQGLGWGGGNQKTKCQKQNVCTNGGGGNSGGGGYGGGGGYNGSGGGARGNDGSGNSGDGGDYGGGGGHDGSGGGCRGGGGDGGHKTWSQMRDSSFVGLEGHPWGTDRR